MSYIGVDPNLGDITFQRFTGNGNDTAFTLAQSVVSRAGAGDRQGIYGAG